MFTVYIIIAFMALVLIGLALVGYFFFTTAAQRIDGLEKSVDRLSVDIQHLPDLIEKGGQMAKRIEEELNVKQNVLKKLIAEADKASGRLEVVEEKIKDKKLDKATIDKILILVNQGFTAEEIAPKLNIPPGEIELVIKLRKYIDSPTMEKL
jgi:orotate phosphoribosyltransferase-like protein